MEKLKVYENTIKELSQPLMENGQKFENLITALQAGNITEMDVLTQILN